ncbi:MAG: DNA mismatch repair endonuclease MutL [Gemmatimonadota bacterium]|nr:DNA mismatch repair endonuclease MutL [Gemmatimonadota bacterium]
MTRRIRILPDAVANQIAAGEVVERPASVVKELVENAVDARAGRVEIAVERGGKRKIRVTDDGVGMGREDALLCFDRHATSKIEHAEDLRGVRTFGFRGEALPSISAVSRLTLETRTDEDEVGTRVTSASGQINHVSDLARRSGTTVEVDNLFFNAPARAKFLKAVSAETRAVSDAVTQLALANPHVTFVLTSDERVLLELEGTSDAGGRIAQVWGSEAAATLIGIYGEEGGFEIRGLVQRPDAAKPGVRRSFLAVNGRPFRASELGNAALRGYRTTIAEGLRPWTFLYLTVPDGEVDVNVHPAKAEVRFRDSARVEALVEGAVRSAMEGDESGARFEQASAVPALRVHEPRGREARPERERRGTEQQIALFTTGPTEERSSDASDEHAPGTAAPDPRSGARPRLWQVLDTYVFAETRDGVVIVDQHAAHERVLFERLLDAYERGGQEGQRLLFPLTLKLTAPELQCVEDLRGLLERAGFEVEGFGGDTVIVHAVPNPHRYFDAERAFREMVDELTHGSELVRSARNQHERIAMTFACKSAIKAGQRLSEDEMQELFDQLFATRMPQHDVHGRPTVVRLSAAELSRKFGRT